MFPPDWRNLWTDPNVLMRSELNDSRELLTRNVIDSADHRVDIKTDG